jgi:hypothetical protein
MRHYERPVLGDQHVHRLAAATIIGNVEGDVAVQEIGKPTPWDRVDLVNNALAARDYTLNGVLPALELVECALESAQRLAEAAQRLSY